MMATYIVLGAYVKSGILVAVNIFGTLFNNKNAKEHLLAIIAIQSHAALKNVWLKIYQRDGGNIQCSAVLTFSRQELTDNYQDLINNRQELTKNHQKLTEDHQDLAVHHEGSILLITNLSFNH